MQRSMELTFQYTCTAATYEQISFHFMDKAISYGNEFPMAIMIRMELFEMRIQIFSLCSKKNWCSYKNMLNLITNSLKKHRISCLSINIYLEIWLHCMISSIHSIVWLNIISHKQAWYMEIMSLILPGEYFMVEKSSWVNAIVIAREMIKWIFLRYDFVTEAEFHAELYYIRVKYLINTWLPIIFYHFYLREHMPSSPLITCQEEICPDMREKLSLLTGNLVKSLILVQCFQEAVGPYEYDMNSFPQSFILGLTYSSAISKSIIMY